MEVRYGNKPLELHPGKPTIEIGEQDNLLPELSATAGYCRWRTGQAADGSEEGAWSPEAQGCPVVKLETSATSAFQFWSRRPRQQIGLASPYSPFFEPRCHHHGERWGVSVPQAWDTYPEKL